MWKEIVLCLAAAGYGCLSSAGVLTVFIAVGLVPRFAGKTHTANKAFLYENMVILGTLTGAAVSIFAVHLVPAGGLHFLTTDSGLQNIIMVLYGFFAGIFVGCLAISIAEMLDSIPIFSRRTKLKKGLQFAVLSMAMGKIAGSILYFATMLRWSKM